MKPKYKLTLIKSPKNKEFFWQLVHKNGREICWSGETYKNKRDSYRAFERMRVALAADDFEIDEK